MKERKLKFYLKLAIKKYFLTREPFGFIFNVKLP